MKEQVKLALEAFEPSSEEEQLVRRCMKRTKIYHATPAAATLLAAEC